MELVELGWIVKATSGMSSGRASISAISDPALGSAMLNSRPQGMTRTRASFDAVNDPALARAMLNSRTPEQNYRAANAGWGPVKQIPTTQSRVSEAARESSKKTAKKRAFMSRNAALGLTGTAAALGGGTLYAINRGKD